MKGRTNHPITTPLPHRTTCGSALARTGHLAAALLVIVALLAATLSFGASTAFAAPIQRGVAQTPTPAPPTRCTVQVNELNLRSGPGTSYVPVLARLARNTVLTPLERISNNTWIRVRVNTTSREGWVNAEMGRVACNRPINRLPIATSLPPRPNTGATRSAVLPPGGTGGGDDIIAELTGPAEYMSLWFSTERFISFARMTDNVWVRFNLLEVASGAEVESVDFRFTADGQEDFDLSEIYDLEGLPADFCYFGGTAPNCTPVALVPGVRWPGTSIPITNGNYSYSVDVTLDDGSSQNWNGTIQIVNAALPPDPDPFAILPGQNERPAVAPLITSVAEGIPGSTNVSASDALTLRVAAYDPDAGRADGDGINSVSFLATDPDGNFIISTFDDTAPYCAFGDDGFDCFVHDFAANGFAWPFGDSILEGAYEVEITVFAEDGEQRILRPRLVVDFDGASGGGTATAIDASDDFYYTGSISVGCGGSERVWFEGVVTHDGVPVVGAEVGFKSRLVEGTAPVTRPAVTNTGGYYSHWVDADASIARNKHLEIWVLDSEGARISEFVNWDTDGSLGDCNKATIDFAS